MGSDLLAVEALSSSAPPPPLPSPLPLHSPRFFSQRCVENTQDVSSVEMYKTQNVSTQEACVAFRMLRISAFLRGVTEIPETYPLSYASKCFTHTQPLRLYQGDQSYAREPKV